MTFKELDIGKLFVFYEAGKGERYVSVKIDARQAYLFKSDEIREIHPNKGVERMSEPMEGQLARDKEGHTLLVSPLVGGRYGYDRIIAIDFGILRDCEVALLHPKDGGEEDIFKQEVYIILSRLEKHLKSAQNLLESIKLMMDE